jgi:sulfite reductase alpha subunit-like flavoprotein
MNEPQLDLEPDPDDVPMEEPAVLGAAPYALMEVLPADVPLPMLAQFVPNTILRTTALVMAERANELQVHGAEGLEKADHVRSDVKDTIVAIEAHFAEPVAIAHKLHSRLTGLRAEWLAECRFALDGLNRKMYAEQHRLAELDAAARRAAQEEADRQAREDAKRRAEEAKAAQAPAAVVESLFEEAESTKSAPVYIPPTIPALKSTTMVEDWVVTVKGTARDDPEQQPASHEASVLQLEQMQETMKAILAGKAPVATLTWNWKLIAKQAKAGQSTYKVAGLEVYNRGGVRSKPRARK